MKWNYHLLRLRDRLFRRRKSYHVERPFAKIDQPDWPLHGRHRQQPDWQELATRWSEEWRRQQRRNEKRTEEYHSWSSEASSADPPDLDALLRRLRSRFHRRGLRGLLPIGRLFRWLGSVWRVYRGSPVEQRFNHALRCPLTRWWLLPSCLLFSLLFTVTPAPNTGNCQVTRVYDGDTVTLDCDNQIIKVRLDCIDTPEIGQKPWGRATRDHLRALIPQQVFLEPYETDRYNRTVGRIWTSNTQDLNLEMVADGQAAVYPKYCAKPEYYAAQYRSIFTGTGIWAEEGLHQTPWEWRRKRRAGENLTGE